MSYQGYNYDNNNYNNYMNGNPAMQHYNQRMNSINSPQMYNQHTQNSQNMQSQQVSQNICRAVTSIEEARATIIDAFNTHLFTNFAKNEIYVKQITNNGTAQLHTFKLDNNVEKEKENTDVNEELNKIKNTIASDIPNQISALTDEINNLKISQSNIEKKVNSYEYDGNNKNGTTKSKSSSVSAES